jgi:signal transduction histidine kinase
MNRFDDAYFSVLKQALFSDESEEALSAAAELGRELLKMELMPEDAVEIHQQALIRLSDEQPELKLSDIAANLMAPMMEVVMAYSLDLRRKQDTKKMLKAKLAHAGRMEAIGTMAAGIAHDFNTILGVINGYAELLLDDFLPASANHRYTQQIIDASARARDLILRMLAFARQLPTEPVLLDVVALVRETLQMIGITLPPGVALVFDTGIERAPVLADPMQIQQIVMNLFMNAIDAVDGHGMLRIAIRHDPACGSADGKARRVCLTVEDDGCGMTQEEQRRVFDPFFTTKAPGKGSGLGLSVVYGTVAELSGEIQLRSEPGKGTCFTIFLPLAATVQDEPVQTDPDHSGMAPA